MAIPVPSLRADRCPVCRARLTGDEPLLEPCRRCGADLRWVRAAERQAERRLVEVEQALAVADARAARRAAKRAIALVDAPATREAFARAALA